MRRTVSAILLMIVFVSLQFGKITAYLYCKWQAEIVQSKPDCGCNDHLVTMFDHSDDGDPENDHAKNSVNEKLNEFTPKMLVEIQQFVLFTSNCFTEYNSALSENFPDSPFHPPIA